MKIKEFGPQMRTMLKQWRARAKDEISEQDLEKAYTMGFEQGEQGNYAPAKDREFMRWMKNDYPNKMTLLMSIWKEGNDIGYSKFLMDSLPEEQEVKGMRKELVVEIQEDVRIPQKDHDLILERGDKIKVLKEFLLSEELEVAHLRGGVPMFHGTSDKQLKNILKHGLLPQSQVYNSKYMQYAGDSENPDYVSVTTSRNHAMMFANNTVREIGGNPIVLVLRYQYPVYHDPEAGGVLPLYLYHGKIEREDIRAYYDKNENKTKV